MSPARSVPTYDLAFWRESEGVRLDDEAVYRLLCDGEEVEGLEEIDTGALMRGFEAALPDFERADIQSWSDGASSYSIYTTSQHLRVDCTEMTGAQMEKLIAVAAAAGCLFYDPQEGERREA